MAVRFDVNRPITTDQFIGLLESSTLVSRSVNSLTHIGYNEAS